MQWSRKWQPTPVLLPGKFHGEEPGGLQSPRSKKAGHNLATENAHTRKDGGRQGRLED